MLFWAVALVNIAWGAINFENYGSPIGHTQSRFKTLGQALSQVQAQVENLQLEL